MQVDPEDIIMGFVEFLDSEGVCICEFDHEYVALNLFEIEQLIKQFLND